MKNLAITKVPIEQLRRMMKLPPDIEIVGIYMDSYRDSSVVLVKLEGGTLPNHYEGHIITRVPFEGTRWYSYSKVDCRKCAHLGENPFECNRCEAGERWEKNKRTKIYVDNNT